MRISIPHGTIKTHRTRIAWKKDWKFQFHMVRLRRQTILQNGRISPISIPHGTIKTLCLKCFRFPIPISIPHGTIKTFRFVFVSLSVPSFQFHMVRLRHQHWNNILNYISISIPHGTIKTGGMEVVGSVAAISIPHGTIKTCASMYLSMFISNFNSTWYD